MGNQQSMGLLFSFLTQKKQGLFVVPPNREIGGIWSHQKNNRSAH